MEITVIFDPTLSRYCHTGSNKVTIDFPEGTTIQQVLDHFKIIPGEVGIILLNAQLANNETILKDKDVLQLFQVFGGG
ncbi:MAG: MoaD/ThiS family protein [Bacillota bacterium]|uniref:MoaD/ThiS family protein n=1 Tax=Thermanaerosceptrum fracticalcis TaxID=1712410 RepID=A0A7G6E4E0_THEFR|nr:MoaD/ThiS family protein [Thermanaerosceptrum fracticalcis]QNB46944.1 MoaD/ThiS family protein [Thermanaerosceptrum fracticalcis]